ncbi:hypothetical protein DPEC_G00344670 [Dallia pectoralis]|uniref:Uncharacterized protein n=1 Tax=Dallia pectoralis TaxID=75939 RepID=A0ACC2F3A5_DALPE|nr:hypothetical protein DPEC_G00344670 [Dallia pectoralis]
MKEGQAIFVPIEISSDTTSYVRDGGFSRPPPRSRLSLQRNKEGRPSSREHERLGPARDRLFDVLLKDGERDEGVVNKLIAGTTARTASALTTHPRSLRTSIRDLGRGRRLQGGSGRAVGRSFDFGDLPMWVALPLATS